MRKTPAVIALITAILGSVGGAAFLHKHPNPTLREVYAACEAGTVSGIVCCEDVLHEGSCGEISPGHPDPFGLREKEESDWDELNKKQQVEAP